MGIKGEMGDFQVHKDISVATTTNYPYIEDRINEVSSVRADLALNNLNLLAKDEGLSVFVWDSGVSPNFTEKLQSITGLKVLTGATTMSEARRNILYEALAEPGIGNVVIWTEPEKPMLEHVHELADPILSGEADITIMNRRLQEFHETYPSTQLKFEEKANKVLNRLLHKCSLLQEDVNLDYWSGPRAFSRAIVEDSEIFGRVFKIDEELNNRLANNPNHRMDLDPEKWFNSIFAPIILALHHGKRVKGVEIPFRYPNSQKLIEEENETVKQKRQTQYDNILSLSVHLLKSLGYFTNTDTNYKNKLEG